MMFVHRLDSIGANRAIQLFILGWDQNGLGGVVQVLWDMHEYFCHVWVGLG